MYYNLVGTLKRRLILELKDCFSRHPLYSKIAPYIQGRFSFEERPQYGIVVKGSGANKVVLSSDNYVGTLQSHVMLTYVGQPSHPLEWVREDLRCVQAHGMLTPPGVYYLEILEAPKNSSQVGYFVIDPLITVSDERLLVYSETTVSALGVEAQLQNLPLVGTLRVYENLKYMLKEGVDYTIDYSTGSLKISSDFSRSNITADYRYSIPSRGPFEFKWNTADTKTLPGIVLAFGKRAVKGNKVAVVVYQDRVDVAQVHGGKNEVSFDLDIIASDPNQMEEIADLTYMYLWSEKKAALEFEGIETLEVSIGGESETVADETAETFFYQTPVTLQWRADWEAHTPMPLTISKVLPTGVSPVANSVFFVARHLLDDTDDNFERLT